MGAAEHPVDGQQRQPILGDRDPQLLLGEAVVGQQPQQLASLLALGTVQASEPLLVVEVHRFILPDVRVVR